MTLAPIPSSAKARKVCENSQKLLFFSELWKSTNFIATWRAFIQVNLSQNSSSVAPTFPANSLAAEPWSNLKTNDSQKSWGRSTGSPHPGDGGGRAKGLLEFLSPNPSELSHLHHGSLEFSTRKGRYLTWPRAPPAQTTFFSQTFA